jgi:hypothetical protein
MKGQTTMETAKKIEVLASHLEADVDDIKAEESFGEPFSNMFFRHGHSEYLVLTDEEADQRAKEYISDSLWAFQVNFLREYCKALKTPAICQAVATMQEKLCEDANEIIRALIDDFDSFVQAAISADGRGHFLATYDGREIKDGPYFIYCIN